MNANEITFGIEIECYIPTANVDFRIGYHGAGIQVPDLPDGWTAENDGSVTRYAAPGMTGIEFVSPILKGAVGVSQTKTVVAWIKAKGGIVTSRCGFHVSVGFSRRTARELAQLVCLVAANEKALYAMTGTKAREQGEWAKPIKGSFCEVGKNGRLDRNSIPASDRYTLLNLTHIARGGHKVEFRVFAGTLNILKILAYVQVCVGLVEKAIKTKGRLPYEAPALKPTSNIKGDGEGELAVNRLFYSLFWKFNAGFRAGRPTAAKWAPLGILDVATHAAAGEICLKMAKRYDLNVRPS